MELAYTIKNRFSPRIYSSKIVDSETINLLIEAARWAPSSRNSQPWRFIVANKSTEYWEKIYAALDDFNKEWAKSAPILILVVAQTVDQKTKVNRKYAFYDVGLSVASLIHQAMSQGVYIRNMGGFSVDTAKQKFNMPNDFEPVVCLAVGYPGNVTDQTHPHYVPIGDNRVRRSISQLLFNGNWSEME